MEVNSDYKGCKAWEEEIYWKHFKFIHFFQILPTNFHDHLVLPEKFGSHMASQLPDKVSLIGPSGNTWLIDLEKTDNLKLVGEGWKDFVKSYGLKENYLLIFKYKRNSSFEVLIFDQESFCENEATYFVKKCRHSNPDIENHTKRIVREGSRSEAIIEEDKEDNNSALFIMKKSKKDVGREVEFLGEVKNAKDSSNQTPKLATRERDKSRRMVDNLKAKSMYMLAEEKLERNQSARDISHISLREMTPPENGESSPKKIHSCNSMDQSGNELSENDDTENPSPILYRGAMIPDYTINSLMDHHSAQPITKKRGRPDKLSVTKRPRKRNSQKGPRYRDVYKSNRREITEVEKNDALQRAKQEQTENSFVVVMRPTCVYKRFYVSIPLFWMQKNLALKNQEIFLRMGDKTWLTMFYYHSKRGGGGLSGGWKNFVLDNSLEESDVLLFKPHNNPENEAKFVLDVKIFRVIPEIIPPLLVSPYKLT